MRYQRFWDDMDADSDEYQLAYDLIRHAMWLVSEYEGGSHLARLQNVLEKASFFVNRELDDLPEQTEELGLHKWQQAEVERRKEEEEEEREQDDWEQEQREEEEALERDQQEEEEEATALSDRKERAS